MYSTGIDDGAGWGGGFFWQGGSGGTSTFDGESSWSSNSTRAPHFTWPSGGTSYFGWRVVCNNSPCKNGGSQWLSVELLAMSVAESTGPTLSAPDGLWTANGWVRGTWPLHYGADSPSGVCSLGATLNGQSLPGSTDKPNQGLWHQCAAPAVDSPVNTGAYAQGSALLALGAVDAAGKTATAQRTIYVDNQAPTVSLSGPTDASTAAGVQTVTATGSAGPSGVAGILCSLDGAQGQWYGGATAQISVQGAGVHHIMCSSANNARDASGRAAFSTPSTWTLSIREPSVSTIAFARVADQLRCRHVHERLRIPARWIKAYHHNHPVRVRVPAQRRTLRVVRCHPHVVERRVLVSGHWVTEPVAELPHAALVTRRRLRPGQPATVSGWLGTANGTALADQQVLVYAAPDNGQDQWSQVAAVKTSSDGSWRARLAPGPSRLVMAVYPGAATVAPSVSAPAHVVVPASISVRVRPAKTHWGGRITISGQLRGGYVPPSGELVVLRIGWSGGSTEIGHLYTQADGTFTTPYTFLRGHGTEHYHLWVESARESDYPYAPGRSRRATVTVTG